MKLLLDTHILLWWLEDNKKLSKKCRSLIETPDNLVFVSAASVWEVGVKKALGKIECPDNLVEEITASGFEELPLKFLHADKVEQLPLLHKDPFDRMLIAQAITESMVLVSNDQQIVKYDQVKVIN